MLYRVHLELIETLRYSGDKQKKTTNFYESLIKYRFRQELDNTAFLLPLTPNILDLMPKYTVRKVYAFVAVMFSFLHIF
jgi:hypothetical protein